MPRQAADLKVYSVFDLSGGLDVKTSALKGAVARRQDTLEMPHPLYMAVEQYATAEALMKDHSPDAAAWEAKGNATIALFLGANERQGTDAEHVIGLFEDY